MSKTQINILFTAVGNQKTKEGKCKIGNVTEIIENETHPYPINQDEEIYERIKPDIVYLFVTKDSVDNAREIYNIYKDREDVEILVQPENCFTTDENEIIHYTNAYDFTATVQSFYSMKTKVMNLIKNAQPCNHPLSLKKEHIVKKVSSDQPEIKFFVNLTAGTKIVSAAASVAAIGINARMCYVLKDEDVRGNEDKFKVFNPKSTFNCDMLDDNSKIVYYAILGFYYGEDGKADAKNQSDFYGSKYNLKNRNGQHTRDNKILKNRTMIGYYIDKISDKNLIERSPATNKRDKPYVITDIGKIVYEYLSIEMKMSFNIDNNNEKGTTGHQDSGGSMKG